MKGAKALESLRLSLFCHAHRRRRYHSCISRVAGGVAVLSTCLSFLLFGLLLGRFGFEDERGQSPFVPERPERGAGTLQQPEPVYQLWVESCRRQGQATGRFGPFSRPLPRNAELAVPSLERVAMYMAGPPPNASYYEKVEKVCRKMALPGSKRKERGEPPHMQFDTPTCFRARQQRTYQEEKQRAMAGPVDEYLEYFGFENRTVIMQLGDDPLRGLHQLLPIWKKARFTDHAQEPTVSLALMNADRHFGEATASARKDPASSPRRREEYSWPEEQLQVCTPFKARHRQLVWRGVTTSWKSWNKTWPVKDVAPRKLLMDHWGEGQSRRIDVGISEYVQGVKGPWRQKGRVSMAKLSANMFLLLPEGNDVASGSAWSLFAASVVFMAYPPQYETIALHGLLVPWIHYIPVRRDFADLDSRIQWCVDNPSLCEDISHRASLFMYHLWPGSDRFNEAYRIAMQVYFDRYKKVIDCFCDEDGSGAAPGTASSLRLHA